MRNLGGSSFAEMMHFEGILYVQHVNLVPELYQGLFFDIECNLQKSVISWTFFYENYFSHSLYLSHAREIFHVSRDS